MDTLVTSLTSGFTSAATSMLSAIGGIVPVMLPVVAGIAVVGVGVALFKKLSH